MAIAEEVGIRLPKQTRFDRNVKSVENPTVDTPIRGNEMMETADVVTANRETAFSNTAIMETATQPFFQWSGPHKYKGEFKSGMWKLKRTMAFWKHDKDNKVIDAPKLGKLLEAKMKASGSKHVEPDEVIITMFLSYSPLDVVKLLKSLREIEGMEGKADALHGRLLAILKEHPGVVSYAWMESEYLSEELFKVVRLDGTIDYDETSVFLSEWLWYIGKYSETHLHLFRVEHAVKLLFQSKGAKYVNAFFDGMKGVPGREKLADGLLELYVEAKNSPTWTEIYGTAKKYLQRYIKSQHLAKRGYRDGIVVMKRYLYLEETLNYYEASFVRKALSLEESPLRIVEFLVKLYEIGGAYEVVVGLHRMLLAHYTINSEAMCHAWMELKLHPQYVLDMLGLTMDQRNTELKLSAYRCG
uniref:RxLR effector candidate protein n=1 Tax=Peronospora matthiolae TaxID=2874970 RepID=A0AAV1TPI1_9STRA